MKENGILKNLRETYLIAAADLELFPEGSEEYRRAEAGSGTYEVGPRGDEFRENHSEPGGPRRFPLLPTLARWAVGRGFSPSVLRRLLGGGVRRVRK